MSGAIAGRVVYASVEPSERLVRACAAFGVFVERSGRVRCGAPVRAERLARLVMRRVRGGGIAVVTGPSGAGKSSLVRRVEAMAGCGGVVRVEPCRTVRGGRAIIDLVGGGTMEDAVRTLALAGLADATLWARTPAELSDGQRWRLALALGVSRVERSGGRVWLVADEFCSTLDRTTARCVARAFARWVRRTPGARAVCATAHADMAGALGARPVVELGLDGSVRLGRAGRER